MTNEQFNSIFKGVNSPEYRGAEYPENVTYAINQRLIEDKIRPKEYQISFCESDQSIDITWIAQESISEREKFDKEVIRVFRKSMNISGPINIKISVRGDDEIVVYTI